MVKCYQKQNLVILTLTEITDLKKNFTPYNFSAVSLIGDLLDPDLLCPTQVAHRPKKDVAVLTRAAR